MEIFWLKISKLKKDTLFKKIVKFNKRNIVFTPNPEILLKVNIDLEFKKISDKANYLTSDGIGLYIAYQILESKSNYILLNILKLPFYIFNLFFRKDYLYKKYWDRICWSELTRNLLKYSNKNNIEITILDLYNPKDEKKVASQKNFKNKLKYKYNNLKINYFIYKKENKKQIFEKIKKTNSKIIFSTLWMKIQEQSVLDVMKYCKNIKLWLWVWSSFDDFTWLQKRAPKVFRLLWFEWLYRLFVWPNKIQRIKRIYRAVFVFIWEIIKTKN